MYYVYLLRCKDGSIYAGITTDLARRFSEHAGKGGRGAKYTASRTPERFECAFCAQDRASASRLEARLKRLTHAQKQSLIDDLVPDGLTLEGYERAVLAPDGQRLAEAAHF